MELEQLERTRRVFTEYRGVCRPECSNYENMYLMWKELWYQLQELDRDEIDYIITGRWK